MFLKWMDERYAHISRVVLFLFSWEILMNSMTHGPKLHLLHHVINNLTKWHTRLYQLHQSRTIMCSCSWGLRIDAGQHLRPWEQKFLCEPWHAKVSLPRSSAHGRYQSCTESCWMWHNLLCERTKWQLHYFLPCLPTWPSFFHMQR